MPRINMNKVTYFPFNVNFNLILPQSDAEYKYYFDLYSSALRSGGTIASEVNLRRGYC